MTDQFVVLALITPDPKTHHGCHIIREGDIYPMIYRPVHGPGSFMDCHEWIGFNCKPIPRWWDDDKAASEKATEDAKTNRALATLYETRKVEIGHVDGVPEVKVEWEGGWIKHPVLYHRDSKITAYAEFSAPDLNSIWGDITTCALVAAGAATIAAIIASPAAALPAFKAAFVACIVPKIGDRAKQISVAISTQQEHGEWHKV